MSDETNENTITDASDLRKYRIELPNLVDDLGLDVYAFRLYVHFKRVVGADDGVCRQKTTTLATACRISAGRVSKAKQTLIKAGLITVKKVDVPGGKLDTITLLDIWPRNFEHYAKRSRGESQRSRHESGRSRGESQRSPRETKKEPIKKEPRKKKSTTAQGAGVQRDPNLDHPAVVAYRDIAKTTPNEVQRAMIAEKVVNVDLWKSKVTEWIGRGWKKYNVVGLLDFYTEPPRQSPTRQAPAASNMTADEKSQAALDLLRQGAI